MFSSLRAQLYFLRLRLRSRWVYWWSQNYHPDLSGTSEKMGALHALEPRLFARWNRYVACQTKFMAVHPTLGQYTRALRQASSHLRTGIGIRKNWSGAQAEPATLESLFTDGGETSCYVDPVTEVTAFKEAAQDFYTLYQPPHPRLNTTQAYNARIFSSFEPHLLSLIEELLRYSHS